MTSTDPGRYVLQLFFQDALDLTGAFRSAANSRSRLLPPKYDFRGRKLRFLTPGSNWRSATPGSQGSRLVDLYVQVLAVDSRGCGLEPE